ncbi:hypothetical protein [Mariniluteicoccus flavus]
MAEVTHDLAVVVDGHAPEGHPDLARVRGLAGPLADGGAVAGGVGLGGADDRAGPGEGQEGRGGGEDRPASR